MTALLTLDELTARVALALSVDYDGAPNDRVRDVPDRRTIRYYTMLGLLDRPARFDGRTALYGPRHLAQLVAIKRLQGHGLSRHEIQRRLQGLTDAALAKIARLSELPEAPPREPPRRPEFWKATPEPAAAADRPSAGGEKVVSGIRLSDQVTVLLPLARLPDEDDVEALRAAAAPLLKLL